jgi:endoglucanase
MTNLYNYPILHRGVNLGGWLSQAKLSKERISRFLLQEDIQRIAEWGFDHVRLPIDFSFTQNQDNEDDFAFLVLNKLIDWVARAGLTLILDLHEMPTHSFHTPQRNLLWTDNGSVTNIVNFWKSLLCKIENKENLVIDLLNEPTSEDTEQWNNISLHIIENIRQVAPDTWIIIESAGKADVSLLSSLPNSPPPKCIYSFHFYEPLAFTHQMAWWSDILPYSNKEQPYPGQLTPSRYPVPDKFSYCFDKEWNKDSISNLLLPSINWAKKYNIPVHCGEFGVYLKGPRLDRYRWLKDVVDIFEDNSIGWCYWNYKNMGFGIFCDNGIYAKLPGYINYTDSDLIRILLSNHRVKL